MTRDPSGQRFLTCAAAAALLLIASWTSMATTAGRHVSNLNGNCMRCLCYASTLCNVTVGCSRGYCGPYYLYRDYWKDAGQLVVADDDPDRDQAFVDCASNVECAQKVVENYMVKWGRDCNKDGVTDCDDYARIHFNGREDCSAIDNTNFWRRYETCQPVNSRVAVTHVNTDVSQPVRSPFDATTQTQRHQSFASQHAHRPTRQPDIRDRSSSPTSPITSRRDNPSTTTPAQREPSVSINSLRRRIHLPHITRQ